jgi:hypothetical protein
MKTSTSLPPKVLVSEHALLQRVNRKLAKNHERLCKTRGNSYQFAYYVLDTSTNTIDANRDYPIINSKRDVETLARKIGVLQNHEQLK